MWNASWWYQGWQQFQMLTPNFSLYFLRCSVAKKVSKDDSGWWKGEKDVSTQTHKSRISQILITRFLTFFELYKRNEARAMVVNNGTEGQSINPTCCEILDIHASITVCCSLTPKFGGGNYNYVVILYFLQHCGRGVGSYQRSRASCPRFAILDLKCGKGAA